MILIALSVGWINGVTKIQLIIEPPVIAPIAKFTDGVDRFLAWLFKFIRGRVV